MVMHTVTKKVVGVFIARFFIARHLGEIALEEKV
jgi:hypothetical protein